MTGPDKPIDGSDGVRELLGTFELGEFGGNGRPFQLPRADFKYFLSEFHSQSPIAARSSCGGRSVLKTSKP
jgi:hypothetical protein